MFFCSGQSVRFSLEGASLSKEWGEGKRRVTVGHFKVGDSKTEAHTLVTEKEQEACWPIASMCERTASGRLKPWMAKDASTGDGPGRDPCVLAQRRVSACRPCIA